MKLILIKEGKGENEGVRFTADEEEFMRLVKQNFKRKFPIDPFSSL
jgi:hypothetical protein